MLSSILCTLALALAAIGGSANAKAETVYQVSTYAGVAPGSVDGPGVVARFNTSNNGSLWPDPSGAILVADTANSTIRRLSPDGFVTTVLGIAGHGGTYSPSQGLSLLGAPYSAVVDSSGNFYVAEFPGIARITPGVSYGQAFSTYGIVPQMVTDADDNIFFVDELRNQVWELAPDGTTTRLAGSSDGLSGYADGDRDSARFNFPSGITLGADGSVYVADEFNFAIRKIAPDGTVTTVAGSPGTQGSVDGSGTAAQFTVPGPMGIDSDGNLYVADGRTIRRVTPAGDVTTLAGQAGAWASVDGVGAAARFYTICGLTATPANEIYVFDDGAIRKVTLDGTVTTVAGAASQGSADGSLAEARFVGPSGIAGSAAGTLYVSDHAGLSIRKITSDGTVSTLAAFDFFPGKIAVDGEENLYLTAQGDYAIRKITPDGTVSILAGSSTESGSTDGTGDAARFYNPSGLTVDGAGNVYVADSGNRLIRKVTPAGVVTTLAGDASAPAEVVDGQGSSAHFYALADLTVDGEGNLWVADGTVRKITPAGVVTTVAGHIDFFANGNGDGTGADASFKSMGGITLAADGALYVTDSTYHTIRRVTTAGVVTTVAGKWAYQTGNPGAVDGQGEDARFRAPLGIYAAPDGPIYVADSGNATIRVITPGTAPTIDTQPQNQTLSAGGNTTLSVHADVSDTSYRWEANGNTLQGGSGPTLTLDEVEPASAGLYAAVALNGLIETTSDAAIVGVSTSSKVIGTGTELQPTDIHHPNGNIFDQVLLTGAAETITADAGQITRTSYIDLDDNIVQVEFAGAGSLSLVLSANSGPARPTSYNQAVDYMKGHAGIVIVGADETTNVSVFTVGRATAFDGTGHYDITKPISATNDPANNGSSLFQGKEPSAFAGIAKIAFIAIASTDGKFGGLRAANAKFSAWGGLTGVYAPGVEFAGPVFVGDITAYDEATPVIITGSVGDARVTGGSLYEDNARAVQVSGLTQLKFTPGSDSAGVIHPAQANQAVLKQDGVDVTAQIVVNP